MNPPILLKLVALTLVAFVCLGADAVKARGIVGVVILLACLNAAERGGAAGKKTGAEQVVAFARGLGSLAVWPFYLALSGLVVLSQSSTPQGQSAKAAQCMTCAGAASSGCGGSGRSGGCGSGCGAAQSGGCGAGCGGGKKTASSAPAALRTTVAPGTGAPRMTAAMPATAAGTPMPKMMIGPARQPGQPAATIPAAPTRPTSTPTARPQPTGSAWVPLRPAAVPAPTMPAAR